MARATATLGHQLLQIAIKFHWPLHTVQAVIRRKAKRGHNENEPHTERPLKINNQELRHLNLNILQDQHQSLQNISISLNPLQCILLLLKAL